MRYLLATAVVFCGATAGAVQHPLADLVNKTFDGRVTRVSDGDTFDVVPTGERRAIRVRVFGIDTPERGEPFSTVARNRTRTLIFDKVVTLRGTSIDTYGRLVATVRMRGTDLALELLSEGLACHYQRYSDDKDQIEAERTARASGAGFWAAGAGKPKCAGAARAARSVTVVRFIGNSRSRVYHAPTCRNADCRNCVRTFASEEAAKAAGFRPAGDCLKR